MATFQIISDDNKTWYGTTYKQSLSCISSNVIQVLGLVPVLPENLCFNFGVCLPVFANIPNDQDLSYFLFQNPETGVRGDYRLQKINSSGVFVDVENPISSSAAIIYDQGDFTSYPEREGFVLSWDLVYSNYGTGTYRIFVNNQVPFYSTAFILKDFTCENIDRTCKIKTKFSGKVSKIGSVEFWDFLNMDWQDELRVSGIFRHQEPTTEITNIRYADKSERLHRRNKINNYTLQATELSLEICDRISDYGMNSGEIFITDNNKRNPKKYQNFRVRSSQDLSIPFNRVSRVINSVYGFQEYGDKNFERC